MSEQCGAEDKGTYEYFGNNTLSGLEDPDVALERPEALRLRLSDRKDCDSARSSDRNERYSVLSRRGWSEK
jgi:hypothetical protein